MAEVEEIFDHIHNNRNFLLSGGAGSGKTYTLVQVIRRAIEEYPSARIACMTYTNAAVKEIEERVGHKNHNVTTIHDFLWDHIKHFQKELKECLIELANNEDVSAITIESEDPIPSNYFDKVEDGIQYKEYVRISEGIISHDQVIAVSDLIFQRYPKLGDIVKDKYKFIFIDEYQDTQIEVVRIFLEHFKLTRKRNIIGFFGDAMQSIYDKRISRLDDYRGNEEDKVREVQKRENRRNPKLIYELANKLRTDGLVQVHSNDTAAPNMLNGRVKEGDIKFLFSESGDIEKVKNYLKWDFSNSKETKELNLTHNLIAGKANFQTLMEIYDRDPILGLKQDILSRIKDNKKRGRPEIPIDENDTFDQVVDKFPLTNRQQQLKKDVILTDPKSAKLYEELREKKFAEVRRLYMDKDQLVDDKKQDEEDQAKKGSKRDDLIRHLYKIQHAIWLYQNGHYNEFLQVTDFKGKLTTVSQKRFLKERIESLSGLSQKSIGEVIEEAHNYGICIKGDGLNRFISKKKYIYDQVATVGYSEVQALYEYLEGRTPFSTQHKTKGTEFDNVLVILDNGGWNNYNFEYLFTNRTDRASVLERTQKIFYVCCTRAKECLAVYFHAPGAQTIKQAKEWFGEANVINLEQIK